MYMAMKEERKIDMKKEERRYVVVNEEVAGEKKQLSRAEMACVYDRVKDVKFGVAIQSEKRVVGDMIKKISYVPLPDGTAEVTKVEDIGPAVKLDTVEAGQVLEHFDMAPYVFG